MTHGTRAWFALFLAASLVGLTACSSGSGSGGGPGPTVTSVTVTPSELRLTVQSQGQLSAAVTASPNANKSVNWSSADEAVAQVSAGGTVTAVAVGTTTITATSSQDPTKSGSAHVIVTAAGSEADPAPLEWTITFGTDESDASLALAVDTQGFAILVGNTLGDLAAENLGGFDAFVSKYDPDGEEVWTRQFGTASRDEATAVATDSSDNIYVAGYTQGSLGGTNEGSFDVFVRKYDPEGNEVWTEQFGGNSADFATAVAVDGNGNVLVAGSGFVPTEPHPHAGLAHFVRKYEQAADGRAVTEVWTYRTDSSVADIAVAADGSVILTGSEWVFQTTNEVFVAKLNPDGGELWAKPFGSGDPAETGEEGRELPDTRHPMELWQDLLDYQDAGSAVAVDHAGNIYVTGYVGALDTGSGLRNHQAFLLRLTPDGEEVWAILFEEEHHTHGSAVALDSAGDIIVSGNTTGFMDQRTPAGTEMFVRKVSPAGQLLWQDIFGDSGWDYTTGTVIDAHGNTFNAGYTPGEGGGPLTQTDVYLRKYLPDGN